MLVPRHNLTQSVCVRVFLWPIWQACVIIARTCHLEPSIPPFLKAAYTEKGKRPCLVFDDAEAEAEEQQRRPSRAAVSRISCQIINAAFLTSVVCVTVEVSEQLEHLFPYFL